jgi:WD40 repeat protein
VGHNGSVKALTFSSDSTTLVSGGSDGTIILWDVATHDALVLPPADPKVGVQALAFSPDGKTLAAGGSDGTIALWSVTTSEMVGQMLAKHLAQVTSLTFSPDGRTLASGSGDMTVRLWNVATREPGGSRWQSTPAVCSPWPSASTGDCWSQPVPTRPSCCMMSPPARP